jgi:hypothetical protein
MVRNLTMPGSMTQLECKLGDRFGMLWPLNYGAVC